MNEAGAGAGKRRRNRRGEGERLRRDVLDATAALLARTGDADAVGMRDIAAAAGVTPPAIYRLFPDKRAVLRAAIAEQFAAFDAALDAASRATTPPRAHLDRRCRTYLGYAATHPGHYRVLFSATHLGPAAVGSEDVEDHPGARSFFRLVDAVASCLPEPERDQRSLAAAIQLWAFLHGLADLRITKPELPWPDEQLLLDDLLDRLLGSA